MVVSTTLSLLQKTAKCTAGAGMTKGRWEWEISMETIEERKPKLKSKEPWLSRQQLNLKLNQKSLCLKLDLQKNKSQGHSKKFLPKLLLDSLMFLLLERKRKRRKLLLLLFLL